MLTALDNLEHKRLIKNDLTRAGEVCAIGAVAAARRMDVSGIDPEDRETVANKFGISVALASEIMFLNDEWFHQEDPAARFARIRSWVVTEIRE
jgi:hypothetical protein